jgi:hypothetical protein
MRGTAEAIALPLRVVPVPVEGVKLVEDDGRVPGFANLNKTFEVLPLDTRAGGVAGWDELASASLPQASSHGST